LWHRLLRRIREAVRVRGSLVRRVADRVLRGFARGARGVPQAVDDALDGLNPGSTRVRVGAGESPRLLPVQEAADPVAHQAVVGELEVEGGPRAHLDSAVPTRTLWAHPSYEPLASTLGARLDPYPLEAATEGLLRLVEAWRETVAPRMRSVVHSTGGLACRVVLGHEIPERYGSGRTDRAPGHARATDVHNLVLLEPRLLVEHSRRRGRAPDHRTALRGSR